MRKLQSCLLLYVALHLAAPAIYAGEKPDSAKFVAFRSSVSACAGWTEQKDQYRYFVPHGLYDIIDGGADEYIKMGMVDGIVVKLDSAGKKTAELYIEDFNKPGGAQGMVNHRQATASEPKPLAGLAALGAFFDEVIGGCEVCCYSGTFYFEMNLTGYDKLDPALKDARALVAALTAKKKEKGK